MAGSQRRDWTLHGAHGPVSDESLSEFASDEAVATHVHVGTLPDAKGTGATTGRGNRRTATRTATSKIFITV